MAAGMVESEASPCSLPLSRWKIKPRQAEVESKLESEFGLPRVVAGLLAQRGISSPEAAHRFLNPDLADLHDPQLLPDYRAAADAILGARERKEKIFIHGDYDVDGVTSAALLTRFLGKIGCEVIVKVPNRFKDGYGVNREAIQEAADAGCKLFLTCDCGVGAVEETEMAHELGMKVVVTDHHTIPEQLPRAEAVVNPHLPDSNYPFKMLCGAGIAFKLGLGMTRELGMPEASFLKAYLELAALGTIADVMPLVDENRIIAKYGLARLLESQKPGLAALVRSSGVLEKCKGVMRSWHVGFVLGPRLNASGRIDDAKLSLDLLLSQDPAEAFELAKRIEDLNETRKREQDLLIEEAVAQVQETGADKHSFILISGENWHAGVLGIVAGRLREKFCRPVFVLTTDPETGLAKGSGRSVPGVDLADAIRSHPELLTGGGHAAAAGMSLQIDDIEKAQVALHDYASRFISAEDMVPAIEPDMEVRADEVTLPVLEVLSKMEPFGMGNPEPCFVCREVSIDQVISTKNPDHPQVMIRAEGAPAMRCPAFNLGAALSGLKTPFKSDVLFKPCIDEYNGIVRVKWEIKDLAPVQDRGTLRESES